MKVQEYDPAVRRYNNPPRLTVPGKLLFRALSGSHAYGTATEGSDEDWRGVYQAPTRQILGLARVPPTYEVKPDGVYWELGHFGNLLLGGNPNIIGMMWIPTDCVDTIEPPMKVIRAMRSRLITTNVRKHYLAWAGKELQALSTAHGAGMSRIDSPKRLSHVPRLLWELEGALLRGDIPVRLEGEHLDIVMAIKESRMGFAEGVALAQDLYLEVDALAARTFLPEPPTEALNDTIVRIRMGDLDV